MKALANKIATAKATIPTASARRNTRRSNEKAAASQQLPQNAQMQRSSMPAGSLSGARVAQPWRSRSASKQALYERAANTPRGTSATTDSADVTPRPEWDNSFILDGWSHAERKADARAPANSSACSSGRAHAHARREYAHATYASCAHKKGVLKKETTSASANQETHQGKENWNEDQHVPNDQGHIRRAQSAQGKHHDADTVSSPRLGDLVQRSKDVESDDDSVLLGSVESDYEDDAEDDDTGQ